MRPRYPRIGAVLALLATSALLQGVCAGNVEAEVVSVIIDRREDVLGGRILGDADAYEKLVGRIFFEFDPANPYNAAIVDLALAPLNGAGRVEAWADFMVLQPKDPARRSQVAWLEVPNRGGKASLRFFNGATGYSLDPAEEEDFGDGLLLRQGLTLIWVGWQWDVPDREGLVRLHVPVARGPDGSIEGWVRADWTVDRARDRLSLGHRGHRPYPPIEPGSARHVLTLRSARLASRDIVQRERWGFVADAGAPPAWIELEGGFEPGHIYELVYRAENPRVVGLGLAAVRDVMSYVKYGLRSEFPAERGVAFGESQTGRFLRHFLYQGFNVDEDGRKVFDGMLIHAAGAGRGSFNHRFAQPSRDAHPYSAFFYPTDIFPFNSNRLVDAETGKEDGLLVRTPEELRPLVFYTNTGYEYWGRAASLIHTSPDGAADVLLTAGERLYHLAGGQHSVGGFPPSEDARMPGVDAFRGNPLNFLPSLRAIGVRLVEVVSGEAQPLPNRYPRLADGTLVPVKAVAFPPIPGIQVPTVGHEAYRADYGPRFEDEGVIDVQPPRIGRAFPTMVPQVDGVGNELGGVRGVELRVPLATYAPWHLRSAMAGGDGALDDFTGTFVPLPRTEAERAANGDPRPSVEALYDGDKRVYLRRVVAAVQSLWSEGFMLEEDAGIVTERAEALWEWVTARAPESGEPR